MQFSNSLVSDLFTGGKRFYVPKYQRSYSWKTLQVDTLWKDLNQPDNSGVFFGTLILHKSDEKADSYGIVDGQQRLTTLSILFLAIRDLCNRKALAQANSIQITLASTNVATGRTNQLRVEVAQDILPAYRYMVENLNWEDQRFPDEVDGRIARKIKTVYKFFSDQLACMSAEEISDLLERLLSSHFLIVELDDEMQAFEIFERNNARGTPLNVADLIKNRLFKHAEEIENFYERWDQIVKDAEDNFPRLLKYFSALNAGHDTGKSVLYAHLKEQAHSEGVGKFLANLESFSEFYRQFNDYSFGRTDRLLPFPGAQGNFLLGNEVVSKRIRRSLQSLKLFGIAIPIPIIYSCLSALGNLNEIGKGDVEGARSEFLRLLSEIECFHFINNAVCTKATNRAEQLYAQMAPQVLGVQTPKDFKEQIAAITSRLKNIGIATFAEFETAFADIDYDKPIEDKPLIAYIFDRIQNGPFAKSASIDIFDPSVQGMVNRTEEIEHIYPKSKWAAAFGDDPSINNIGNLIVITQQTNREVGSRDLEDKIKIFEKRNCDNRGYVTDLVQWVKEKNISNLNPELIRERAKMLAKKAHSEVWNPWPTVSQGSR